MIKQTYKISPLENNRDLSRRLIVAMQKKIYIVNRLEI